jgi:predicted small lipoprotein YifL
MKKVLSLLAIAMVLVGLTGCNDDPDGAKQRPGTTSSVAL